jgi:adenylate cyclase
MATYESDTDIWHDLLSGRHPTLRRHRNLYGLLPSDPRCSLCKAPFRGPGGILSRMTGREPSRLNPTMCRACEIVGEKHPGGVEIETTMLFADIRGSTSIAEDLQPAEFRHLIDRFYVTVSSVLVPSQALIGELQGDQVTGIYLPAFAGPQYTCSAIGAAQQLLRATGHGDPGGPWAPVGVGIHTGPAFVGAVGKPGATQITALGDAPNIGARLASRAAAGEILVSGPAAKDAGLSTSGLEHRVLELKGRRDPVDAYVIAVGRD